MLDGDILIQRLWDKALIARGLEAIIFWTEYDIEMDSMKYFDCWN